MSAWITLRVRRERVEVAGDPVVEAGAQADDQVAALQAGDRGDGAVHAGHAEVLRVAVGEGAAGHQRGDDRHAGQLGEHPQLLGGAGADHAAADVQHRAAGLEDQPGRLADLLGVRPGHRAVAGQRAARSATRNVVGACIASLATSTSTGPGRPVEAM